LNRWKRATSRRPSRSSTTTRRCVTSVFAADNIGSVTVNGDLIGKSALCVTPVFISARGPNAVAATADAAIGRISIGGRAVFAEILAGYDVEKTPLNGNDTLGIGVFGKVYFDLPSIIDGKGDTDTQSVNAANLAASPFQPTLLNF
jgi:hypothetical protein